MKIPRQRIEAATSTDPHRAILQNVFLDGDKIVATDGRLMVILPVEREEGDVDGVISKAAMNDARFSDGNRVRVGKRFAMTRKSGRISLHPRADGSFPAWKAALPKDDDKPSMTIGFDVNLMVKLLNALASNPKKNGRVKLEIWDKERVIRVTSDSDRNGIGLLMPVHY